MDVLPPGRGNTTIGTIPFSILNIAFQLGTPNQSNSAVLQSTTPNIVILATTYDSSASSTYVPTGQNGTVFANDNNFTPLNSTGPLAYEKFAVAGLTAEGQGFLRQTSVRDQVSFIATNSSSFIG